MSDGSSTSLAHPGAFPYIVTESFKPHWTASLPSDLYHADKTSVSSTSLRKILKSPANFYSSHVLGIREDESDAFRFGSAFHMALLEPEQFQKMFVRLPKFSGEGSVKARQEWKDSQITGAVILKEDEFESLQQMLNSVLRHKDACNILKNGKAEQSGYFRDPETGILCRIRPDFLHEGLMALLDVKTTKSVEASEFSKACWNFRYDFQLYMYCLGIQLITGKKVEYPAYLAIEKKPPYEVAMYVADDAMLQKGCSDYRLAMSKLKTCLDTNCWDGYQQGTQTISLPKWAFKGDQNESIFTETN